jgi:serine/threonine protein kinase
MNYLGFGKKKTNYYPFNNETQRKLETNKSSIWCIKNVEMNLDILKQLLLDRYGKRQQALNDLMKISDIPYKTEGDFFSNFINYFDVDVKCLCEDLYDLSNKNSVFHIREEMGGGNAGKAYNFEMNGDIKSLVIKTMVFTSIKDYLSIRTYNLDENEKLINPSNNINCWKNQKGEDKIIVAEGTDFSNQTCLHLILNTILQDTPNYVYQYDAFICKKENKIIGYNIMELANNQTLDIYLYNVLLTDLLLNDVILQIFSPLSILKKSIYGFSHSDLKPRNIFVNVINDIPTFKIADYDKSSITWNSVRFYNGSRDVNAITDWVKFGNFQIKTDNSGQRYYDLYTHGGGYGMLQTWTMHNQMGVPLSYDFYTFMIITLLIPKIWEFLKQNKDNIFSRIWDYMWYPDDLPIIMKFIQERHDKYNLLNDNEQKKYFDTMQSIGELNKFLGSSSIKFKYEIEPFFQIAGVEFKNDIIDKNNYFIESEGGKICYDKCFDGKCKTNKYTNLGRVYEWDYCKEK